MKKQKLKNYLKLGIFLFGISLTIFACQKESINDLQEISKEKKLKRISLNELNTRIGNSESYTALSAIFDINKPKTDGLQQRLENSDNPYLLTDEIAVVDTENAAFYTFKIESNNTGNEFYNLVVAMDEFNNIRSTRIFEYIPSDNWLQDTSQPFEGQVEVYENDIFSIDNINNTFSSRGSNQCATGLDWEWVEIDCPNNCDCTACFDLLISVVYSDCPETIDAGGSGGGGGGFPVDGGNTGGGGGGTPGGSSDNNNDNGNPPADGENCILDNNGNCLTDETTPLPPPRVIIEDGLTRECRKISDLLEENPEYKTKLLQLASEASTATFEKGVAIDKDGNDINIPDGVGGKIVPPLNPSEKYLSIAHIHDSQGDQGNGTFSVPSLNDLANLGHISVIYDKAKLNKMVYFVFTADGTYYALTINSPNKFRAFWAYQKLLHDNASLTDEQRKEYGKILLDRAQENNNGIYHKYYNNENGSLIDETSTDNEQQLKYFLQFLQEEDGMGVSVFETDAQLSQFNEVKLNESNPNGTPQRNDCE